jgi:solute carrier family 25 iron transporter 28/37
MNAVSRISTTEGSLALWRGVNSVLIGAGPSHALSFSTYEGCKSLFRDDKNDGHQILADGRNDFVFLIRIFIKKNCFAHSRL